MTVQHFSALGPPTWMTSRSLHTMPCLNASPLEFKPPFSVVREEYSGAFIQSSRGDTLSLLTVDPFSTAGTTSHASPCPENPARAVAMGTR